jgi:hypothetical protein
MFRFRGAVSFCERFHGETTGTVFKVPFSSHACLLHSVLIVVHKPVTLTWNDENAAPCRFSAAFLPHHDETVDDNQSIDVTHSGSSSDEWYNMYVFRQEMDESTCNLR